jgi:hypothetical protein
MEAVIAAAIRSEAALTPGDGGGDPERPETFLIFLGLPLAFPLPVCYTYPHQNREQGGSGSRAEGTRVPSVFTADLIVADSGEDARRSTLDARRSTLDARRSTLDARRSTLGFFARSSRFPSASFCCPLRP